MIDLLRLICSFQRWNFSLRSSRVRGKQACQIRVVANLFRRSFERDAPAIHHVAVLRDAQGQLYVLFDDENSNLLGHVLEALGNLLDYSMPHAFGGLVQHHQIRPGE